MIKYEDLIWKEHKANNIQTNPLEDIYCIIDTGDSARMYFIKPQYPLHEDGSINTKEDEPELYILFENIGYEASNKEKREYGYQFSNYDGYVYDGNKNFCRAFKSLEEAKHGAYQQYVAIFGFVLAHLGDVEKLTADHFVVK